jgi:hypothetical protein
MGSAAACRDAEQWVLRRVYLTLRRIAPGEEGERPGAGKRTGLLFCTAARRRRGIRA